MGVDWPWRGGPSGGKGSGGGPAIGPAVARLRALLLVGLMLPSAVWADGSRGLAREGNELADAGKYAEAVEKYRGGLVDEPESPLLRYNLGVALYRQGEYAQAVTEFTKVLSLGDETWTARAAYNLGNTFYRLGKNAEPGDPQAALQSYSQAIAMYRRAMAADHDDTDPKFGHEFVSAELKALEKRLEEEAQAEQENGNQGQEDEQQPNGQRGAEDQSQEQAAAEGQDRDQESGDASTQEQPQPESAAEDQAPQVGQQDKDARGGEGQQAGEEQAAGDPRDAGPDSAGQQSVRAILDTARGEELGPEDIVRSLPGVAELGNPARDW